MRIQQTKRQWNNSVISFDERASYCCAIVPTDRFTGFSSDANFFIFGLVSLPAFYLNTLNSIGCHDSGSGLFLVLRQSEY